MVNWRRRWDQPVGIADPAEKLKEVQALAESDEGDGHLRLHRRISGPHSGAVLQILYRPPFPALGR